MSILVAGAKQVNSTTGQHNGQTLAVRWQSRERKACVKSEARYFVKEFQFRSSTDNFGVQYTGIIKPKDVYRTLVMCIAVGSR